MHSLNTNKHIRQRRQFLKTMAHASLVSSGMAAMSGKLGMMGSALAATSTDDHKALVCVYLHGGSDSFNMFVPTDNTLYANYKASRGSLAIDKDDLLMPNTPAGFGFNPYMPRIKSLFDGGKLSVVSNVGNLITPITRSLYQSKSQYIPTDLFAHNHQEEQWLKGWSGVPSSTVQSGWGGRMADRLMDVNSGAALAPTFSLSGSNHWLPGNVSTPLSINPASGLPPMSFMDTLSGGSADRSRQDALTQILSLQRTDALQNQAAQATGKGISAAHVLASSLNSAPDFQTPVNSASQLSVQLRMVANLIASQQSLSMQRQIFFVSMGGWDTHDSQSVRLNTLLHELDDCMADFYDTLAEIGKQDAVTSFTASDFGRTLTVNGDGSDHGWGGHYMVMGGAVNGGQLFGQLPTYLTGADDDTGDKGRVIPSISINQFGASMGKWMGLSDSDLHEVFPDLANFGSSWQNDLSLLI